MKESLEQVYRELEYMFNKARGILYDIGRHNPGIQVAGNDKKDFPELAAEMGKLATGCNKLNIDFDENT